MKLKKYLFFSPLLISFVPFVSCQYIGEIKDKSIYIKSFNKENYFLTSKLELNTFNKIDNDTESLLFAPIISYNYYDKMIYDNVNNEVKQSTKKYLKLNLIDALILEFDDDTTQVYNNSYYSDFNQSNKNEPIIKLTSSDIFSINNEKFISNLNKAKKIKFIIKDINYVDKSGNKTNYKLRAEDFIINFSKEANKKEINKLLEEYAISFEIENEILVLNSKNNLAGNFIFEQMIKNMIFNPVSTSMLKDKNIVIDQFKPNLDEMLFLSSYILNKNTIEQQVFIKNFNSPDQEFNDSKNTLTKILLNFKSTPLDDETFRLQTFKSFRQALVSEANLNIFNSSQIENIKNNSSIYGLQPKLNYISNSNINKLVLNYEFDSNKKFDFNNYFSKLVYGSEIEKLTEHNIKNFVFSDTKSILFRNYLINSINVQQFIKLATNNDYWLSQSNPSTDISEGNSSYKKLSDAYTWANQQYVFSRNLKEVITVNPIDYKYYDNSDLIIDYEQLLRSPNYDFIKTEINKLIDEVYLQFDEKISFTIPYLRTNSSIIKQIYKNIEQNINNLDKRLDVKFVEVEETYFKQYNSFIKFLNIEYINDSYSELIKNYDLDAIKIFVQKSDISSKCEILSHFSKFIQDKQENFNELLFEFIKTLSSLEKAKLISELDMIFNSFINPTCSTNINNFSYEIVQNDYIKPVNDLGYEHFQSIRIR